MAQVAQAHASGDKPAVGRSRAEPRSPWQSSSVAGQVKKRRRSSREVDQLRARALVDDELAELTDAEREWVWRSVLKGIRIDEACVRAFVHPDDLDQRLA